MEDVAEYYQWSQEEAVRQYEAYDFDKDEMFLRGLGCVLIELPEDTPQSERDREILRAKLFYFSRSVLRARARARARTAVAAS